MNRANILAVLIMVAVTSLAVGMISGADSSFAQNDTTTMGNQSSGAVNDTAMENVTGSGSISACVRGC